MNLGDIARKRLQILHFFIAAMTFMAAPHAALAAVVEAPESVEAPVYTPLGPDMIKGQPTPGGLGLQTQYSPAGHDGAWLHTNVLMWVMGLVSLLVLGLLLYVMLRYNSRANPVPSKTSHNTVIEVIWTAVPVLVLLAIAVPSIAMINEQYKSPPEDALTVKVTGYQWYWGYTYPDNGGFEVISNMMPDEEAVEKGLPPQLAVDNRMVVPVGEEIRIQVIGADVIHSFAVPSLWFKLDAVPGRLNELKTTIEEPGIYYGQCSELCGVRHGYMPIAIEAVSRDQYEAWVLSKGGTLPSAEAAAADADEAAEPAAEEAAAEAEEA